MSNALVPISSKIPRRTAPDMGHRKYPNIRVYLSIQCIISSRNRINHSPILACEPVNSPPCFPQLFSAPVHTPMTPRQSPFSSHSGSKHETDTRHLCSPNLSFCPSPSFLPLRLFPPFSHRQPISLAANEQAVRRQRLLE